MLKLEKYLPMMEENDRGFPLNYVYFHYPIGRYFYLF